MRTLEVFDNVGFKYDMLLYGVNTCTNGGPRADILDSGLVIGQSLVSHDAVNEFLTTMRHQSGMPMSNGPM